MHPSITFMCPPLVNSLPKRGNKKSKKVHASNVHRVQNQIEFNCLASLQDKCTSLGFLFFLHFYIDNIVDVDPD